MKSLFSSTFFLLMLILHPSLSQGQNLVSTKSGQQKTSQKILSGRLIEEVNSGLLQLKSTTKSSAKSVSVVIYFNAYPQEAETRELQQSGIQLYPETWTPPLGSHILGFMLASLPVDKFAEVLAFDFVVKIDFAGRSQKALNNVGAQMIKASLLWSSGITGKGVKIGILDSGIDVSYAGTDLPESFVAKDYSGFPNIDNSVSNQVTGHGTHVAATALGRGVLSEAISPDYNGSGAFKGAAPDADLLFLKIGNDSDAIATDAVIIAAIDAAVNSYNVDVLSLSYGGWDDFHDGSSAIEQKVDWAVAQGVPFFCAGGNSANAKKHWSGIAGSNNETDFIKIICKNIKENDTRLRFNLVWTDGSKQKDITLKIFDAGKQPFLAVDQLPVTESLRGTQSQYTIGTGFLQPEDTLFYLKIVNNYGENQFCHIYEDWSNLPEGNYNVSFENGDAGYTIGSPASADSAFAVGAYVSRHLWNDYTGQAWVKYGDRQDSIAPFSNRGPRIDGLTKPDICAPGAQVISLRDKDIYTEPNSSWIDNDGIIGEGEANYYKANGTSMACPFVAGAAALFIQNSPGATPHEIYAAFSNNAENPGGYQLPNNVWGAGKLNLSNVYNLVELKSPANGFEGISEYPKLIWHEKEGIGSYRVQVAADNDFDALVFEKTVADTNAVIAGPLGFNTTYYWRVKTDDSNTLWSEIAKFTTGGNLSPAGYALWFNGVNDHVEFPHSNAIDEIEENDKITVEAWIYIEKWMGDMFPIIEQFWVDVDWGWAFAFHNQSGFDFNLIWSSVQYAAIPPLNSWVHVAISYDRSAGKIKFYRNGKFLAEKDFDANIPNTGAGDPFYIAANKSGGDEYTSGYLDEIKLWKTIRTEAEITEDMFDVTQGNSPDLAAWFSFNQAKGDSVNEETGNFEKGVLRGNPIWVVSEIAFIIPESPTLLSPENGEEHVQENLLLSWSGSAATENYILQISETDDFTNLVFTDSSIVSHQFQINSLETGRIYFWRVKALNNRGESSWSDVFTFNNFITDAQLLSQNPTRPELNIFPNPVESQTTLQYSLPANDRVQIVLRSLNGQAIRYLVDGYRVGGIHSLQCNCGSLKNSVYLLQLKGESGFSVTRRMVVMKNE